jgi:hypothetical protein
MFSRFLHGSAQKENISLPPPASYYLTEERKNYCTSGLARSIIHFEKNINYLCTCDLYTPVHNVLEAWIYIMWGSWRGLGPGIPEFFGPCEMATSR